MFLDTEGLWRVLQSLGAYDVGDMMSDRTPTVY